jgi:NAD(P)-dependent dehydrogenase (short-subunit alcohol dehydrogenase family)
MKIENKNFIISGGASGLGEATTKYLISKGVKVGILDLNEDAGLKLVDEFKDKIYFAKTDISDDENVGESITSLKEKLGSINGVVNCAGIAPPKKVYSAKKGMMDGAYFQKMININLVGCMNVIRHAVNQMVQNDANQDNERGVIVNTASIAAFEGQVGQTGYSASKGGIVGLTLPLARDLASFGIRVMTIAPGLFLTPMLKGLPEAAQEALVKTTVFPKRLGDPVEYAKLVEHIAENPMLNGETIRLDGAIRLA